MSYADNFKVYGPYVRGDSRKIVIVVSRNGKRRTVSYPKWIMECHLGRKLHRDRETVDHWDSNYDNNDINNLRLVPRKEHSADDTRRVKFVKLKCAWCDKEFERSPRVVRDKAKKKKAGPFCSRSCAGKYTRMLQLSIIKKFKPQKSVESEYYKRKYITASYEEWEDEIDYMDLISYASEDGDYLYHETDSEYLQSIKDKGILRTSFGQSFLNDHGEVMDPEFVRSEIENDLSQNLDTEDLSDEEFNEMVDEVYDSKYNKEDEVPRTYVHTKEPLSFNYGNVLLRFPKDGFSLEKDVDHYILDNVNPEKIEFKVGDSWRNIGDYNEEF